MLLSPQTKLLLTHYYCYSNCSKMFLSMGSKHFLLRNSTLNSPTHQCILHISSSHQHHLFHSSSRTNKNLIFSSPKRISPIYLQASSYYNGAMSNYQQASVNGFNFESKEEVVHYKLRQLREKLDILGIDGCVVKPGQYNALLCPKCQGGGSAEKSLSLKITDDGSAATWNCFRATCGWHGVKRADVEVGKSTYGSMSKSSRAEQPVKHTVGSLGLEPLGEEILAYFAERMISEETLKRNDVMQQRKGDKITIAFPYWRDTNLVSCKFRNSHEKAFWQVPGAEKIFYGLNDIKEAKDIIIVEGEMDKLAMEEAGFRNCVSVPDGAPSKISVKDLPHAQNDVKYSYLWNCKQYTDKASRIIIATDADKPGQALAEEVARRLGKERCWRVKWPKRNESETETYKDANEVLVFMGAEALRDVVVNAELYPIQGLFNFRDFNAEIDDYYHQTLGFQLGVSTGWKNLDGLYTVVPGELTVVTGVPNSGKSEWIDALIVNLNRLVGWKFVLCSMENQVKDHARKLLEKHIRKPFFDVRYGQHTERMSPEELEDGKKWLNDSFFLIRSENEGLPSIKWVLELARIAVLRHGIRGLVIDPYNELDHQRPGNQTETEYVSQMLTSIKRFAQHYSCHVWFVAHPRQLHNWTGGAPNLYEISGSAHFINKCDNGVVIHRNRDESLGPLDCVQVCVRKVRNKVAGTIGDGFLNYSRVTGEYTDVDVLPEKPFTL